MFTKINQTIDSFRNHPKTPTPSLPNSNTHIMFYLTSTCFCPDTDRALEDCQTEPRINGSIGWICPACGKGCAPWNPTCPCTSLKKEKRLLVEG